MGINFDAWLWCPGPSQTFTAINQIMQVIHRNLYLPCSVITICTISVLVADGQQLETSAYVGCEKESCLSVSHQ